MKERPILFSTAMVQAILAGQKTMTRRVIKSRKGSGSFSVAKDSTGHVVDVFPLDDDGSCLDTGESLHCPYGEPGDLLWVRETFGFGASAYGLRDYVLHFKADGEYDLVKKWKPSIHMPKKYARIWLEVKSTRVERIQDIATGDILMEGTPHKSTSSNPWEAIYSDFESLWDSINAKRGYDWDKNPWVWVIEFERVGWPQPAKEE